MAERVRLRIRAYVVIDIVPETTAPPPSFNGGPSSSNASMAPAGSPRSSSPLSFNGGSSSSTPRQAPVGTPRMVPVATPRYPPPGFPSPPAQPRLPGYYAPDFARLFEALTNERRVDPSDLPN